MCLIAFAWRAHPDFPLIVAGNRDEFFARPTAPADWWADRDLLAGRDLRAGGTWMGVSRSGRFAALTNYRDPARHRPDAPSRGALVGDFIDDQHEPERTLERIEQDAHRYHGFNLLAAQWSGARPGMWIVSNADVARVTAVEPGVHALSNAYLDSPWPKVEHAIDGMRSALDASGDREALVKTLFAMLDDRGVASDERLPRTGVALDTERALSAAFIRMPGYGTRASTVLLVERSGAVTFVERRREPDQPDDERRFVFERSAPDPNAARVP